MTVQRIDHFVITCRDIAATLRFYTEVLGMKEVTFGNGRKALAFGRQKINLHPVGQLADPVLKHVAAIAAHPTPGSADVCFVVGEPLDAVIAHLGACGVPIEEGPVVRTGAVGPIHSLYVRDPDGNLIELSNYRDED
ncbi:MAG TPA: VOC family protein [Casimicrobiaceae bacterium]|nr:VOC family protein [Casimicrobiaceae bacterium]